MSEYGYDTPSLLPSMSQVGTGLGPTLEFYALVSRELQRSDLMLFRGEICPVPGSAEGGASSTPQYIHSAVGVFPAPLGPSTPFSVVEQVCNKFRFLGKLMAKAIMDSRMVSANCRRASWLFYRQSHYLSTRTRLLLGHRHSGTISW